AGALRMAVLGSDACPPFARTARCIHAVAKHPAVTGDVRYDVVILSAVRTPIGAFQGALAGLPAHALGARALTAAYERAGVAPEQIQQVTLGCVLPAGQGQPPARQAALGSGCPPATGALTLNKVC